MNVVLSQEARHDIQLTLDWYIDQEAWSAAADFLTEAQAAFDRLSLSPGLGTPGPAGTRMLPLHRFPVSVVYRHDGDAVHVVALAAQRRRPGYWVDRG
ncbi:MAG: hypothetical protein RJA34_2354 [Pseudomonadota bacterium]|jgi:plasmid stabilization system protein ParE